MVIQNGRAILVDEIQFEIIEFLDSLLDSGKQTDVVYLSRYVNLSAILCRF